MFREMRRNKQALSDEECREILERCTSGTLAVLGDEGYPYAVPLSYVFINGHIYFHCARAGHKLDAIRACDKVSFCVIDRDEVIPEKFTTKYRSVIVFGRAREVTDPEEIVGICRQVTEICCCPFRELLKKAGVSQAEFCRRFFISRRTVDDWVSGKNRCKIYLRLLFAEKLGLIERRLSGEKG